ncbi:LytR C-terminal domain-containing protein [Isoptericola sp. b515]|uniref:LytR C-terminal domain-containing protein n=1 Tax=Isoptericola sp. b515 TaxID=3064652 RepID=UPI002713BEAC|nr:LytR C-terminal domain-containing protein [Isoptericola sp. b515]MDO8149329.1 LytR C-terminal domain-containing protein [Isoptericola sp. b515]
MTKSHYPYPPDEFDVRGPEGSPVGVHREPRSGWSSAWPFLLVAVVFAGLAVAVVGFLSDDPGGSENPPAAQQESAAPESSAEGEASEGDGSGEESGDGSGDGSGEESGDGSGDESGEGSDEATEEPAEESGPDIASLVAAGDTSAYVRVLNDKSGIGGEAARGAEALGAQGFSNTEAANLEGDSGQTTNVVWYAEGRAETAAAVAAILGVPAERTSQQPLASGDVVVIIKESLQIAE